ncbi:MAG: histidine--tRNA ligase [bacterium]
MTDKLKNIQQIQPPKGTRDFLPDAMILRRNVMETIRQCFALYGFSEIDSPVFEYFELLSRKCGEEIEKEIYTFHDKADRKLGLRFEFTSPLGRYYASNNAKLTKPFKRYVIGKVYRYENTQNGRYREFYQADADIIGVYSMLAELELIDLAVFTLEKLGLNNYEIHLNNRKILDGIIEASGIPVNRKEAALRILDKLSKIGEDKVIKEFIDNDLTEENYKSFIDLVNYNNINNNNNNNNNNNVKNADDNDNIDNINKNVNTELESSSILFLEYLKEKLKNSDKALEGINELVSIFENSSKFNLDKYLRFDPLLVRGLGYYTGPIFEIKSLDVNIGSFAAGGRYDNLIELYGARPEGACGLSFGVDRIIDIIQEKNPDYINNLPSPIKVFIAYLDSNEKLIDYSFNIAKLLRINNITCEINLNEKLNISKQLKYANNKKIPYTIVIGADELKENKIKLKDMKKAEESFISLKDAIKILK